MRKIMKNITPCAVLSIALILFGISSITGYISLSIIDGGKTTINSKSIIASDTKKISKEELLAIAIDEFLVENESTISFYTNSFQITEGYIADQIRLLNTGKDEFDETNVFNLTTSYESFDEQLFNYVIGLLGTNPEVFSNNVVPTYASKEYMIGLIDYFCGFYPAVDAKIAKTIVNVESGYAARSMLNKNNIFGGMSGGSVITYKTIEYGVFSYIKLLNDGYFSQGLTTVESIGYKYNPTYENGVKVASPSWVSKIYNYLYQFEGAKEISVDELLNLQ